MITKTAIGNKYIIILVASEIKTTQGWGEYDMFEVDVYYWSGNVIVQNIETKNFQKFPFCTGNSRSSGFFENSQIYLGDEKLQGFIVLDSCRLVDWQAQMILEGKKDIQNCFFSSSNCKNNMKELEKLMSERIIAEKEGQIRLGI